MLGGIYALNRGEKPVLIREKPPHAREALLGAATSVRPRLGWFVSQPRGSDDGAPERSRESVTPARRRPPGRQGTSVAEVPVVDAVDPAGT